MQVVKDYGEAITIAQEQTASLGTSLVIISMAHKGLDEDHYKVYDLGDVVIPEPAQLRSDYDEYWGDDADGTTFLSEVFSGGITFGELVKAADKSIEVTQDHHHIFLENVRKNEALTAQAKEFGFDHAVYDMEFGS
jgi:hypothetical protein